MHTSHRTPDGRARSAFVRSLSLLALLLFSHEVASAQPTELVAQFENRSHTFNSLTIPYRLFVPPAYDSTSAHPLVLTLHGSGERGTNNTSQIAVHRIATAWADTRVQSMYAPFVVSPQAPPGGRWENVITSPTGTASIRPEMATVLDLLDSLEAEFNIDPNRIYVTGLSLGGYGTFDAVYRAPDRFAAAVPMSGGYSPILASGMRGVPFWILHGESDGTVPPSLSKNMVTAFELQGRKALYTNCGQFGCSALSNEQLDAALLARPDLIYTGVPNLGHGPWAPWYDDPRVQDWLMTQRRLVPDAVTITAPSTFQTVSGVLGVSWTIGDPADSLAIYFSGDLASTWTPVAAGYYPAGNTTVNTAILPDTPFGLFQVLAFDDAGLVYGRDTSAVVVVDNSFESVPFAHIDRRLFQSVSTFAGDAVSVKLYAADAESATVDATVSYSTDDGETFTLIETFPVTAKGSSIDREIDLAALPNSENARIRLEVTDGIETTTDVSPRFNKATSRQTSPYFEQVAGSATPSLTISFTRPDNLTGHRYQITFTVPESGPKAYDVMDTETNAVVVSGAPVTSSEGPEFDGMRLSFEDVDAATQNRDLTGWTQGNTTMQVSIRAPRVTLDGQSVQSLATPADYRLVVTSSVSDTSSSLYGYTAHETNFYIENTTAGERRDFLFDDKNGDGMPSSTESLYILEEDPAGAPTPAWLFTFVNGSPVIAPEDGDVFTFVTTKPIAEDDVFEIVGAIGVATETTGYPGGLELKQNYPNPFSDDTAIEFVVDRPGIVTLRLYDVTGREIRTLLNADLSIGEHVVSMTAESLAAGIYFYRLESSGRSLTKALLIMR